MPAAAAAGFAYAGAGSMGIAGHALAYKPDVMLPDIGLPGLGFPIAERIGEPTALEDVVLVGVARVRAMRLHERIPGWRVLITT